MTVTDHRRIVARKRDGHRLAPDDIEGFIRAFSVGEVSEGLAAAFLMACCIRGLDEEETLALTRSMIASGTTVEFGDLAVPTVDKHSTGGVADGVTLIFAPLAAAVGLGVAKLSGRGLGHTGGTLDKLEAIPGLRTDLSPALIEAQVDEVGCAIAAQSANLVPADGALYALRDATATVPSVPLIAASVMAKKLAVRTDLIILDVKAGSGAFMKTAEDARDLAAACLALAAGAGRPVRIAVTDMSQPLGNAVGNAIDIAETVALLRGEFRGRLRELAVSFVAHALEALDGSGPAQASRRVASALDSGDALERFGKMVRAQGGDPRVVDDPEKILPRAPVVQPIIADRAGVVGAIDTEAIGSASGTLGAGRIRKGDAIDPAVGIVVNAKIGSSIEVGEPIGEVHARDREAADLAASRTVGALTLSDGSVEAPPLVHGWFGG